LLSQYRRHIIFRLYCLLKYCASLGWACELSDRISRSTRGSGIIDIGEEPGRTKSEDTRERILEAAIQRFSNFGYRRTSINDVAEEAGLARATVYLYWKKKEDLFVAGLVRFHAQSWGLAEAAAAKEGTAAERIQAMIMAQYGATSDIVHGTASGHEVFEANLKLGNDIVEQCLRHGEEILIGLLQQGIQNAEFNLQKSSASPEDVAHMIISFAQNSLLDRHHTPLSYRESLRKTLNFILDSIRA
jgi:AcrR family transcriptional regulator